MLSLNVSMLTWSEVNVDIIVLPKMVKLSCYEDY